MPKSVPRVPRRRGMALVMVLGIIAITLAVSYAVLRTQATTSSIQANADLSTAAHQAAQAGIAAGLRRMSNAQWAGVNTSFTGSISTTETFTVSYTAGDVSLQAGSSEYDQLPFRVTLTCTGKAVDAGDTKKQSKKTLKAVVQLIRRKFGNDPSNWNTLQPYSLYQWNNSNSNIQTPLQIQGSALLQAFVSIDADYPCDCSLPARTRYLTDLEALRAAGNADWRPFTGTVYTPNSRNSTVVTTMLQGMLNVSTVNITASTTRPIPALTPPTTYRMFAGGPEYTIPNVRNTVGSEWSNVTLESDVATNPLGVFRASGDIKANQNVTVRGTLLLSSGADLRLSGSGIKFEAKSLPALDGGQTVRLPTLVVGDDLRIDDGADAEIVGLCVVSDETEIRRGAASTKWDVRGQLVTKSLYTFGREPWYGISDWAVPYQEFLNQLPVAGVPPAPGAPTPITNFVTYLESKHSLASAPLIKIRSDTGGVATHWHDWTQPMYLAHPNDGGLRWDLVRWEEIP